MEFGWTEEQLRVYVDHTLECFGPGQRVVDIRIDGPVFRVDREKDLLQALDGFKLWVHSCVTAFSQRNYFFLRVFRPHLIQSKHAFLVGATLPWFFAFIRDVTVFRRVVAHAHFVPLPVWERGRVLLALQVRIAGHGTLDLRRAPFSVLFPGHAGLGKHNGIRSAPTATVIRANLIQFPVTIRRFET